MFLLRWLDEPPEAFVRDSTVDEAVAVLPRADPAHRLRWDLQRLHRALDSERQNQGFTWAELAVELGCTPSRLTNLKRATHADLALVVGITQWLSRPSADFIHPAAW